MRHSFKKHHRCRRWNLKGLTCPFEHGEEEIPRKEPPDDNPVGVPVLPPIGAPTPYIPIAEPAPAKKDIREDPREPVARPVPGPPVVEPFPLPPPPVPVPPILVPTLEREIERLLDLPEKAIYMPKDPKGSGGEERPFWAFGEQYWNEAAEEAVARTVYEESPINVDNFTQPRRAKAHPRAAGRTTAKGGSTSRGKRPGGFTGSPGQGLRATGQARIFDASAQFQGIINQLPKFRQADPSL